MQSLPPTSSDLLQEFERKRDRSREHLRDLREPIEKFRTRDQKPIRGALDPEALQYYFDVKLDGTSPEWPLLLGDFVYDARASLDYLITALIRSAGNRENDRSQFPIHGVDHIPWAEIDEYWEKDPRGTVARNLEGTPVDTKAALKPLQPFFGVPKTDPHRHPLFSLQVMSNRDKHRRLNLLASQATVDFVDATGQRLFGGRPSKVPVVDNEGAAEYRLTLAVEKELAGEVWLRHSYDVHLGEPPELVGDLIETLSRIDQFIDAQVVPTVLALM